MAAPVVVVLNRPYAEQVARHLYGDVYTDLEIDQLLDAMQAAAVTKAENLHDLQTDLFGGDQP